MILLSTGMRWYVALLFTLLSQLTALVGFLVGVAVSTNNEEANGWILAIAAGVFLYISLVDLVRYLISYNSRLNIYIYIYITSYQH